MEDAGFFDESSTDHSDSSSEVSEESQKEPVKLVYSSTEEFLHKQLLPTYIRELDGKPFVWCRQWYFHPEAVARVEGMWRAWENLRLDAATGLSVWYKDHADHHMPILMDSRGPFQNCDMKAHRETEPIELELAPPGWFADESTQQP